VSRKPIQPRAGGNFIGFGADASCSALRGLFYESWPGHNKNRGCEALDKTLFMRACREGGAAIERALRELDRAFFAILYRDAIRILRDSEATRDLVQDTFIKVWRRCASYRGESELLRWIKVILRHGAIERLRQTAREVPMEDWEGLTEDASRKVYELSVELNPTPEALACRAEYEVQFRSGWKRFHEEDPLHAGVMTWIVEDGLSNDDIAQLLDRTPGATREFVSQCRKRARRYLAGWYALASNQGGPK
jgi:RNA polymerase sigma-70 factor (ECF subfamily)